ncbi:Glu-tRNA(Gln) amidotransferase subunit GatD [Candidatus Woesearchaeota archaeon]|nr:Glu-tRNA(Gln) amidotransferase subunit GatD [Candidatus Woesearchaeota archaeon]
MSTGKSMASPGESVRITTTTDAHEGTLLPDDNGFLVLKLASGYNIGIDKKKVKRVEVLPSSPKPHTLHQPPLPDEKLPLIAVLHTGGTIASKVDYATGAVVARFTPEELLSQFPELASICRIRSRLAANMFSEDMRFSHYNILAKEVAAEVKQGASGIIITHGTDTMHFTAAALSFALPELGIPVLLVGAQRSSDRGSSDAALNLLSAAMFITQSDFAGVALCMHETIADEDCLILPGTKTRKFHTSRRDAFQPVDALPVARVNFKDKRITFLSSYVKRYSNPVVVKPYNEDLKVGLLKVHTNMYSKEFKSYAGFDGLVIEGTGLGHAPINVIDKHTEEHKDILAAIKGLVKKGTVVAMASQTIYGAIDMNVYSTGRLLLEAGVLGNGADMTPETAFIKLAWLLSNFDKKEIPALWLKNFAGELEERRTAETFFWRP